PGEEVGTDRPPGIARGNGARVRPDELHARDLGEPEVEEDQFAASLAGDEDAVAAGRGGDPVGIAAGAEVLLETVAEVGLVEPRHRVVVLIRREDVRRRERERARIPPHRPLVRERARVAGTVTRLSTGTPSRRAGTKRQRSRTVARADSSSAG